MSAPAAPPVELPAVAARASAADWLVLCKVRLNSMVVATTLGGAWLGSGGSAPAMLLVHATAGTALTACGASALNMVIERRTDALMERTRNRPIPAGRMRPAEAVVFGTILCVGGLVWLALGTNLLAAALAAFTVATYLFVYTPLKFRSASNTLVGAVPGAVPPMIGWAAADQAHGLDAGAWALFGVLYLWQIPHFLSIAWLHREDYRRAGLVMLPGLGDDGAAAGRQAVHYSVSLLAASLFAVVAGLSGPRYAAGAIVLGALFTAAAVRFARERTDARARTLLHASLLYLPLLFLAMGLDRTVPPAKGAPTVGAAAPATAAPACCEKPGEAALAPGNPAGPLPVLGLVPDFSFTERSGRVVGRKDLLGRIWVADFIFTSCAGTCPVMTSRMAGVHQALRAEGGATCVSFSVDPERDTLEALRTYADRFSASAEGWWFLRGPQKEIHRLEYEGFKMGDPEDPMIHSERFVLVDGAGRIRGWYRGTEEEETARLLADARRLREERP